MIRSSGRSGAPDGGPAPIDTDKVPACLATQIRELLADLVLVTCDGCQCVACQLLLRKSDLRESLSDGHTCRREMRRARSLALQSLRMSDAEPDVVGADVAAGKVRDVGET